MQDGEKWRGYRTKVHRYFKNYRNHSQALKVVLYEDSKSYPVPNPIYLQKHETKRVEFQIPVVYSSGIEKDEVPNIKIHSLHEDDTK